MLHIKELLDFEDEAREQPLLNKARLFENLLLFPLDPEEIDENLNHIKDCYTELVNSVPKRTKFYQESLDAVNIRIQGRAHLKNVS